MSKLEVRLRTPPLACLKMSDATCDAAASVYRSSMANRRKSAAWSSQIVAELLTEVLHRDHCQLYWLLRRS